jgi:hypothetical protein
MVSEPTSTGKPDPERTTWIGRAKPPAPPPPPTDPYWPPVEAIPLHYVEPVHHVEYVHGYPASVVRPPRPRRTGRNILITMLGVFALCCGGGAVLAIKLSGGLPGTSVIGPAPPGLNTPVKDGKFTFVVSSVTCGKPSVGRSVFTRKAQGTYCLVAVTVQNTGTEAQSFSDGFQKLLGSDGTVYSADIVAGVIANENIAGLWTRIVPGNKVSGTIVYDVPMQTQIAKVELHDSGFSKGAVVTL